MSARLLVAQSGSRRLAVGLMLGLVWRPIHFGMQRRQLLNLKRRVEREAQVDRVQDPRRSR